MSCVPVSFNVNDSFRARPANMRYGITTAATDFSEAKLNDWRVRLLKAVLFLIPRANPDTEHLYPQ
eukprot:gene28831-50728_t